MTYKHRNRLSREYAKIPPERIAYKKRKTKQGVFLVLVSALIAWLRPDWPWQVPLAVFGAGMLRISEELVTKPLRVLGAFIKDLKA